MQFGIFALAPFFLLFFFLFFFLFEYSSVSSELFLEKLFETKVVLLKMMCQFACNLQLVVFNRLFLPFFML